MLGWRYGAEPSLQMESMLAGQLLEEISFPALNVSSCSLWRSRPDLDPFTSPLARKEMDREASCQRYAALRRLFRIPDEYPGMPRSRLGDRKSFFLLSLWNWGAYPAPGLLQFRFCTRLLQSPPIHMILLLTSSTIGAE